MDSDRTRKLAGAFRTMHEAGCFVIPNPYDVGSALYLERLGFKAVATSSAGFAFTQGLPDAVGALSLELALQHVRDLSSALSIPVSVDFQAAYADEPAKVADHVRQCVEAGAAGLSVEDATGEKEKPLYDTSLAVDRIKASRAAIDATGIPAVLTARCEAYLVGDADPAKTSLDRLVAYAEAGADCLFAPGVKDVAVIDSMVKAVAPKALNVIVSSPVPGLDVKSLGALGVRRISVGSALARAAWGGFMRAAQSIHDTGTFEGLAGAATFADLEALFGGRKAPGR